MKQCQRFLLLLSASAAVFAGAYGLLLGMRQPLRLETLSGDPALLDPYAISFSLADSRLEQRYTLRSGAISQRSRFFSDDHVWQLETVCQEPDSDESGPADYIVRQFRRDRRDYLVRPQARRASDGTLLPPGVFQMPLYSDDMRLAKPVFSLAEDETAAGFWALEDALYCASERGGQTAIHRLPFSGEPSEVYPLGEVRPGFLAPAYRTTYYSAHCEEPYDSNGRWRLTSLYPVEPDGAQLFPLDGGRLLALGAWVEAERSGIDLYLLEPGRLLYHGRIATDVWLDYRISGYEYGEPRPFSGSAEQSGDSQALSYGRPAPTAPLRYFTAPEVVPLSPRPLEETV